MGLNDTPSSERVHIGFFGRRNAGKSSVMNAVCGQQIAVVSDVKGTTTDPVLKAMELLPLGPVTMMDTPGIDDEGELGALRVKRSYQILNKTDIAVLVVDARLGMTEEDEAMLQKIRDKNIPHLIVFNKTDLLEGEITEEDIPRLTAGKAGQTKVCFVSAESGEGIHDLKETIAAIGLVPEGEKHLVSDLIKPLDTVVLVVPVDKAAPKGRLILPQQQTIRDLLEGGAITVVVKDTELKDTLEKLATPPKLVITDSQVFGPVGKIVPEDVLLTSFSILFARYKGNLATLVKGVAAVEDLKDGDTILISEGCTHHRQCDDIGTYKIPKWLAEYTGKDIRIATTSGVEFPEDLSPYRMVIHCGGCTLNEREVKYRIACAEDQGVPITNYGIFISYVHGILKRSVKVMPDIYKLLP